MIRLNIIEARRTEKIKIDDEDEEEHIWDLLFKGISKYAHRNDRYNLGMAPDWVFTPKEGKSGIKYSRHIMDMPFTGDKRRYDKLISELNHYRLALGQPNQKEFVEHIEKNPVIKDIGSRGFVLNFFPTRFREIKRDAEIENYLRDYESIKGLVEDARSYLEEQKGRVGSYFANDVYVELSEAVEQVCNYVERNSLEKTSASPKSGLRESIRALHYFIDIHDEFSDHEPQEGFKDDLRELNKAKKAIEQIK
jgi:hypothetical protein